ncbi:hypothetical protein PGT21_023379 [Puccinia graminis f. sp. tritici]|uniref:Uncharacterized protein n=1 Tax=Puccinia graminis f. sp. tritici TaxID=56615 RepID=A0A5B0MFR7_PUCGR|nr:hypothetical protein PGT21_023379 [Puccinia graminis f. sp. tritici]
MKQPPFANRKLRRQSGHHEIGGLKARQDHLAAISWSVDALLQASPRLMLEGCILL